MSKEDAVKAYRDSLYDAARLDQEYRIGTRSVPLVGGIVPGLQAIGNALWRPLKVGGALLFGYDAPAERPFPELPEIPKEFQGTQLGKAFDESQKLRKESTDARVQGFAKLLSADISGWWKESSVASFNEARERNAVFSEEGEAQKAANAATTMSFVDSLSRGSSSGSGRST